MWIAQSNTNSWRNGNAGLLHLRYKMNITRIFMIQNLLWRYLQFLCSDLILLKLNSDHRTAKKSLRLQKTDVGVPVAVSCH